MQADYRIGLGINEDHADLASSITGFVNRWITPDVVRSHVEEGDGVPPFWNELAAQGLLGLHIAERHGGQGGGLLDLAVALEVIGRTCAPGPFVPTVLASAVLSLDDGKAAEELLPGLADGSIRGSVSLASGITGSEDATGSLVITGRAAALCAAAADVVIAAVDVGDEARWIALDTAGVVIKSTDAVDVTRGIAEISVDGLVVPQDRVLGVTSEAVRSIAAIVLGAEAVGVASWCVSTAAEYAKVRVQFGRPIGQFQGVKHRCARAVVRLEQARAAVWDAARAHDGKEVSAGFAAAVARLTAPDAAVDSARDCMQVLGGIGYTWEHDAHLFYRRALALRGLLGRSRDTAAAVAERALAGEQREIKYELPPESEAYRIEVRAELTEIAAHSEQEQLIRLGDGGWVMPFLPPPFGRNAGPVEQVVIAEELDRAGITPPQLGLAAWLMPSVAIHGTEQQGRELVAPTLRGEIVWCQLYSEPEAGSDLAALRTEAVKVDGGWRVNGQKIWTSLGFIAEWGALIARTDPKAPKHRGITNFVVNMESEGITVRPLREASGGTLFSEIFFDNVFIPDSGVVGDVNDGWQVARGTLGYERVALGKGFSGVYADIDDLLGFARKRGASDVPRSRIGSLVADNQTMQLLNGRTLLRQLRGIDPGVTPNISKYLNMKLGQQIADFCHAELGELGVYEQADELSSKWIEQTISSRPMTVYGGTTEVQLNVIGERVLGLPRDPEPGK